MTIKKAFTATLINRRTDEESQAKGHVTQSWSWNPVDARAVIRAEYADKGYSATNIQFES